MNITSAKWHNGPVGQLKYVIQCNVDGTETWVPVDPANTDYAEILRQVAAGELTIADAD